MDADELITALKKVKLAAERMLSQWENYGRVGAKTAAELRTAIKDVED